MSASELENPMRRTLASLVIALGIGCSSPHPINHNSNLETQSTTHHTHAFDTGWQQVLQGSIEQALATFKQGSSTEKDCSYAHEFLTEHKPHFKKVMPNYKYCKKFKEAAQDAHKVNDLTSASLFEEILAFLVLHNCNNGLASQHLTLAGSIAHYNRDYARAQTLYEKAKEYGPASYCAAQTGNLTRALELAEQAQWFHQATQYALTLKDTSRALHNYKQALAQHILSFSYYPSSYPPESGDQTELEQLAQSIQQKNVPLLPTIETEVQKILSIQFTILQTRKKPNIIESIIFWAKIAKDRHSELVLYEKMHYHDTASSIARELNDDQCLFDNNSCSCGFIPSEQDLSTYGTALAQKAEKKQEWHTAIEIYQKMGDAGHTKYFVTASALFLQLGDVSAARELLKKQPSPPRYLPSLMKAGRNSASIFAEQGDFATAREIYEFLGEQEKAKRIRGFQ